MGRAKLPIKKIENITNRQVTFSKRRNGIIKKAYELSVLCDVDVALIMFSPAGKPSTYAGKGSMEEIMSRYVNLPGHERGRLQNREYLERALGKLERDEQDRQVQIQVSSASEDSQLKELQHENAHCKSYIAELEKQIKVYQGDPSEISTLSEAEYRERILEETLKHVCARKRALKKFNNADAQSSARAVALPLTPVNNMVQSSSQAVALPLMSENNNMVQLSSQAIDVPLMPVNNNMVQSGSQAVALPLMPANNNMAVDVPLMPVNNNMVQSGSQAVALPLMPANNNMVQLSSQAVDLPLMPVNNNIVHPSSKVVALPLMPVNNNMVQSSSQAVALHVMPANNNMVQLSSQAVALPLMPGNNNIVHPSSMAVALPLTPVNNNMVVSNPGSIFDRLPPREPQVQIVNFLNFGGLLTLRQIEHVTPSAVIESENNVNVSVNVQQTEFGLESENNVNVSVNVQRAEFGQMLDMNRSPWAPSYPTGNLEIGMPHAGERVFNKAFLP